MTGIAIFYLFCGERKIVETGFCGNFDASAACIAEEWNCFYGTEVNDVKGEIWRCVSKRQYQLNRGCLK